MQACSDRWSHRLPWPLSAEDRAAGYEHRLSIWQVETSLTQVFGRPVHGRQFFEEVLREHLDLGRPDRIALLFPRRLTRSTPPPPHGYRTRILTRDVTPTLRVDSKRSHVKQYLKLGRARRTETTINNPYDFKVDKGIENLAYLRHLGDTINRRLPVSPAPTATSSPPTASRSPSSSPSSTCASSSLPGPTPTLSSAPSPIDSSAPYNASQPKSTASSRPPSCKT